MAKMQGEQEYESAELRITPLFVLNRLERHEGECARRWWSVFILIITNLIFMVGGMSGILVTMLMHQK